MMNQDGLRKQLLAFEEEEIVVRSKAITFLSVHLGLSSVPQPMEFSQYSNTRQSLVTSTKYYAFKAILYLLSIASS